MAEIDALGRCLGHEGRRLPRHRGQGLRKPALGASAAVDRLHLRSRDRGAGRRRFRGRRHPLRQRHPRPPLPRAGALHGAPLRRLRREARPGLRGDRPRAPPTHDRARRRQSRLCLRPRGRLRRGAGRGGLGPRRMAGRPDGRVRGGISRNSRRGDPPYDPREPEMLRHAADGRRPLQQVRARRQHRRPRRWR